MIQILIQLRSSDYYSNSPFELPSNDPLELCLFASRYIDRLENTLYISKVGIRAVMIQLSKFMSTVLTASRAGEKKRDGWDRLISFIVGRSVSTSISSAKPPGRSSRAGRSTATDLLICETCGKGILALIPVDHDTALQKLLDEHKKGIK